MDWFHFLRESTAYKMFLFKKGCPGHLRVWLKINKMAFGFPKAGGTEK
jgi:hypothetical protein